MKLARRCVCLLICLLALLIPVTAQAAVAPTSYEIGYRSNSTILYLNGHAAILTDGTTAGYTMVYDDENANGVIDTDEEAVEITGLTGSKDEGYDLSQCDIYGAGCLKPSYTPYYSSHTGDILITMLGGNVKSISASRSCSVDGAYTVNMTGGKVESIYSVGPSSTKLTGNVAITIGGDAEVTKTVYGGSQNGNSTIDGSVEITIKENANVATGSDGARGVYLGGNQTNDTITGTAALKVSGGTINGAVAFDKLKTVFQDDASIIISGGTINTPTTLSEQCGSNGLNTTFAKKATIEISGGTVNADVTGKWAMGSWKEGVIAISGGTINGAVSTYYNNEGSYDATAPTDGTTIYVENGPVFGETGYIVLHEGEFVTVKDNTDPRAVKLKVDKDENGVLLACPNDDSVNVQSSQFSVINSEKGIVYGTSDATAPNIYLGSDKVTWTVSYETDENGTLEVTQEDVEDGSSPTAEFHRPNNGYRLSHYVANKDVTLRSGGTIAAGEPISKAQLAELVMTEDLTLKAIHERKPASSGSSSSSSSSSSNKRNDTTAAKPDVKKNPDTGAGFVPNFWELPILAAGCLWIAHKKSR